MRTRHAILGRRARLLGPLGLGIIALCGPVSATSAVMPDAAGRLATNPFHLDSAVDFSSTNHGKPAHDGRRTGHRLGLDGEVDPNTRGGKLFLSLDRTVPERGKGAEQGLGLLAAVSPATRSGQLVAGSWPGAPSSEEPAQPDPVADASPPHAPSHPVAAPGDQASPGDPTESRSDAAGVPSEISGDIDRAADRGWIALLPSHFGPHFMAHGPVSTSLPNPSVRSPFCVGLLGMRLAGQDEQLAGQRGTGCERSQSSPTSNSIIYLRIRLL